MMNLNPTQAPRPVATPQISLDARVQALASLVPGEHRIDLQWCDLQFKAEQSGKVGDLLALCDGQRDVRQIAEQLGWSSEKTRTLVSTLYARGVLSDPSLREVPALLSQEHLVSRGRTLRARMSASVDLLGDGLHRRRLLGTMVETWHFVAAASYHIGAALTHAPGGRLRDGLSRLFADEYKHGEDLRRGLLAAGVSGEEIATSTPLPETQSVINYLRTLGETDLLSYGVCAAINESPKSDTAIKETWDRIGRLGLLPPEAVKPFRGHELEDEASDHTEVSALLFSEHGGISAVQQQRVQDRVLTFIALQKVCYLALQRFYFDAEGPSVHSGAAW